MMWFALQIAILLVLAGLLVSLARHWPYPAPAVRRLLPAERRWPEAQIREMLEAKRFHPRYLAFFNRDPARTPPARPGLLAPADGRLLSHDCRDGIRYIVIALTFWDVHVQRSPVAGRVREVQAQGDAYRDGEGRDFAFLAAKQCPVQTRVVIDSELGPIAVRLITSVAARRIEVWHQPGAVLARGERLGRILLGSTVVLEVPDRLVCCIAPGERVRAGESIVVEAEATAPRHA